MSRARTYTKSEIADAAAMAALHHVRVVMHPTGEIEFAPKSFPPTVRDTEDTNNAWEKWQNGRKTRGGT